MYQNEPVFNYLKASPERIALEKAIKYYKAHPLNLSSVIDNQKKASSGKYSLYAPENHNICLGTYDMIEEKNVINQAIDKALEAKIKWARLAQTERNNIFMRVAELLATDYRAKINASTMLGQSKNIFQAEIEAACENIDFIKYNIALTQELDNYTLIPTRDAVSRYDFRPLEGFTYAISPFNFTAIAANLPSVMALMGNVVIWKPSLSQLHSASVYMDIMIEAGLPPGVIQMIVGEPEFCSQVVLNHKEFSGLHYTGSSKVFQQLWSKIGKNIQDYHSFPRIVGETGGKDFMLIEATADKEIATTALIRGAFEYQGQKCSAASRAYISNSVWKDLEAGLIKQANELKMGSVEDSDNFINAVIHKQAYERCVGYIQRAKKSAKCKILVGGNYDSSKGWFIEPTIILTTDVLYESMVEEIFGPILTIYVYQDHLFDDILDTIDTSTPYALTGGILSQDRYIIKKASDRLRGAAGNLYINDKCTGAVIGQQPFGGSRKSGTNDKAGSIFNLSRWISPRVIKESTKPARDYAYLYMKK